MPNFEGPFSGTDIIRIFLNNLSANDQTVVLCFMVDLIPIMIPAGTPLPTGIVRLVAEGLIGVLPLGGTVTKIVNLVELLIPTVASRCALYKRIGVRILRPE